MKIILIILLICPMELFGQNSSRIEDYQRVVKSFYNILYSKEPDTIEFKKVYAPLTFFHCYTNFLKLCKLKVGSEDTLNLVYFGKMKLDSSQLICYYQITQGLTLAELDKIVDNSVLYEDDSPFLIALDLTFPNKKIVHFQLSTESPSQIFNIKLNNGDNLDNLLLNEKVGKLQRIGTINDPDGYTNVRSKPDKNSKVVTEFKKDILFLYTPIGDSDWWPVYLVNSPFKPIGYIHKSKILSFKKFPKYLKEELLKRSHC